MGFNLRLESLPILKNKFMVNDAVLLITVLTFLFTLNRLVGLCIFIYLNSSALKASYDTLTRDLNNIES